MLWQRCECTCANLHDLLYVHAQACKIKFYYQYAHMFIDSTNAILTLMYISVPLGKELQSLDILSKSKYSVGFRSLKHDNKQILTRKRNELRSAMQIKGHNQNLSKTWQRHHRKEQSKCETKKGFGFDMCMRK